MVHVSFQVEITMQHAQRTCKGSLSPCFGLCERSNHWHEGHETSYRQIMQTVGCTTMTAERVVMRWTQQDEQAWVLPERLHRERIIEFFNYLWQINGQQLNLRTGYRQSVIMNHREQITGSWVEILSCHAVFTAYTIPQTTGTCMEQSHSQLGHWTALCGTEWWVSLPFSLGSVRLIPACP